MSISVSPDVSSLSLPTPAVPNSGLPDAPPTAVPSSNVPSSADQASLNFGSSATLALPNNPAVVDVQSGGSPLAGGGAPPGGSLTQQDLAQLCSKLEQLMQTLVQDLSALVAQQGLAAPSGGGLPSTPAAPTGGGVPSAPAAPSGGGAPSVPTAPNGGAAPAAAAAPQAGPPSATNAAVASTLKGLSAAQLKTLGATNKQAFLDALRPAAEEAQRLYGVPAAVTQAQAALETGWGKNIISGYNLFGMKGTGPAGTISEPTWEVIHGRRVNIRANFQKFHNFDEGIVAHGQLFHNGYYSKALANFQKSHDPKQFARDIDGIYATGNHYASTLISIMQQFHLA